MGETVDVENIDVWSDVEILASELWVWSVCDGKSAEAAWSGLDLIFLNDCRLKAQAIEGEESADTTPEKTYSLYCSKCRQPN